MQWRWTSCYIWSQTCWEQMAFCQRMSNRIAIQKARAHHPRVRFEWISQLGWWIWLVVDLPLKKMWKSVGMMTFPIYGK
jgi:hypothetical protein